MREYLSYFRDLDRKSTVIMVSSVFLMTFYIYQGSPDFFIEHFSAWFGKWKYIDWLQHLYQFLGITFFLGLIPYLIIRYGLKESLSAYGVQVGDWKFGVAFTLVAMAVMLPMNWFSSMDPEFQAEYPLTKLAGRSAFHFLFWELNYLIYYISWEFFFRGYMQLGLKERLGAFTAIMMQTIPSTIIHIGKPEGEMLAAIFGGLLLGALALRTRSILYPLIIHWFLGMTMDFCCLVRLGMW